jgi:nucleoside-diphosphate-sugar epimerase
MSGLLYEGSGVFNLSHPQNVSSEMLFKTLSIYYPKFVLKIFIPEILVFIEESLSKWSVIKKKESMLKPLFHKSLINSTKAIQELNYTPKIDIQAGIQAILISKTKEIKGHTSRNLSLFGL